MTRTFTTAEAARQIGIHVVTLNRWIALGLARPSQSITMGRRYFWRWTISDIKHARLVADRRRASGHWPVHKDKQ